MKFQNLTVDVAGPIGSIVLSSPDSMNALSIGLLDELIEAAALCNTSPDLKVVVVSAQGRAFSVGADLTTVETLFSGEHPRPELEDLAGLGGRMADAIESIEAVTIAAIHGHCVGGGVVLVAACDLRVVADSVKFSIPETALGIPLGWGGVQRLVRTIGPEMANDLILTCRMFGGAEAVAMGLVGQSVPAEQLSQVVDDLASTIASRSTYVVRQTKKAVARALDEIVTTSTSPQDAVTMVGATFDEESSALAAGYLARFL